MKVILLEDVKGTGKQGQLVEVNTGHARNYLIPRKLAAEATKANMAQLEGMRKSEEQRRVKELEQANALAKRLEEKTVMVEARVGENGKLFGSVTSKEIAEALGKQFGIEVDKRRIVLDEPIKTVGERTVDIKLHSQVVAKLKVAIGTDTQEA